jgi:hypothetical protein
LRFGLGGVVLLAPESKLLVHGIHIVVDELNALTQGSSVLANTLDHALDELQLFISKIATRTDYLFGSLLLLLSTQLAQADLVFGLLLLLGLFLHHHFAFRLCLDALDVLGVFSFLSLEGLFNGFDRLFLGRWRGRRGNVFLFFFLPSSRGRLISGFFNPGSGRRSIGLGFLLLWLRIGLA